MYASLGCGALSAKSTAGPNPLFLVPEIHGQKHFCDLYRNAPHNENSDHLTSFKETLFETFHFCDSCRRCTGTEIISEF